MNYVIRRSSDLYCEIISRDHMMLYDIMFFETKEMAQKCMSKNGLSKKKHKIISGKNLRILIPEFSMIVGEKSPDHAFSKGVYVHTEYNFWYRFIKKQKIRMIRNILLKLGKIFFLKAKSKTKFVPLK